MAPVLFHVVATSKDIIQFVVSVSKKIDRNIQVVAHANHSGFVSYCKRQSANPLQLVVTNVADFGLPDELVGQFLPIVYVDDSSSGMPEKKPESLARFGVLRRELSEAYDSLHLFTKLKSRLPNLRSLSDRERVVVRMATEGIPNKRIAKKMNLSVKTIEQCRRGAYKKLSVRSSAEVASLVTFGKFFASNTIDSNR